MSVASDTRTASIDESRSHDAADSANDRKPVSPAGDVRALVGAGVFSANATQLAAFYGMLFGVRFEHRVHTDGRDHRIAHIAGVEFELKATHSANGERTLDAPAEVVEVHTGASSNIELSFAVPDAAASYDYALTLGATTFIPVEDHAWGSFGSVLDPDGNRVGLFSTPGNNMTRDASTDMTRDTSTDTTHNTSTDTTRNTSPEGDR